LIVFKPSANEEREAECLDSSEEREAECLDSKALTVESV
jgi:hypothetical protein